MEEIEIRETHETSKNNRWFIIIFIIIGLAGIGSGWYLKNPILAIVGAIPVSFYGIAAAEGLKSKLLALVESILLLAETGFLLGKIHFDLESFFKKNDVLKNIIGIPENLAGNLSQVDAQKLIPGSENIQEVLNITSLPLYDVRNAILIVIGLVAFYLFWRIRGLYGKISVLIVFVSAIEAFFILNPPIFNKIISLLK